MSLVFGNHRASHMRYSICHPAVGHSGSVGGVGFTSRRHYRHAGFPLLAPRVNAWLTRAGRGSAVG